MATPRKKRQQLNIKQILTILPQRYPLVMVDRVTDFVRGKRIHGHKCVSSNEPYMQGVHAQSQRLPGVLLLEAMSQLCTLFAHLTEPFDNANNMMYVVGIDRAKFRRTVTPGDRVDLHAMLLDHRSNVWKFAADAKVDGHLCAEAELLASVVDR